MNTNLSVVSYTKETEEVDTIIVLESTMVNFMNLMIVQSMKKTLNNSRNRLLINIEKHQSRQLLCIKDKMKKAVVKSAWLTVKRQNRQNQNGRNQVLDSNISNIFAIFLQNVWRKQEYFSMSTASKFMLLHLQLAFSAQ